MRDDPVVVDLVLRARQGDKLAWDAIVERYAPLVWSVCRKHGLAGVDAEDVGGGVWLRLVENLGKLREPAALPGWLATTARRECLLHLGQRSRQVPVEEVDLPEDRGPASDEELLAQERRVAVREAFATLPDRCRNLLAMLFADPPVAYQEISSRLEMPVGAIGPNRKRCLAQLRRSRPLRRFDDEPPIAGTG